ncbi:MAG: hypothetical protein ACI85Q_000708 [Salibacteraceae bacterium]|jgi:hypothetical protein
MKYIITLLSLLVFFAFPACKKVENSLPLETPADTVIVTNGFSYFINANVGGTPIVMYNNIDSVGNGVWRENTSACGAGVNAVFTSYFAYVSDTSRKQWISFGLKNCVADSADGFSDSTYYVGSFPVEISKPDTAHAFINFMDVDSVLWSSSVSPNGLNAQATHSFNVTEVIKNYDSISALKVKGNLSGWVYNATGDSLLVNITSFYSRAWAY